MYINYCRLHYKQFISENGCKTDTNLSIHYFNLSSWSFFKSLIYRYVCFAYLTLDMFLYKLLLIMMTGTLCISHPRANSNEPNGITRFSVLKGSNTAPFKALGSIHFDPRIYHDSYLAHNHINVSYIILSITFIECVY